jgi:hypothetical protein
MVFIKVTQHAILDILNTVQSNMDNSLYSCGIFIDLRDRSLFIVQGGLS